MSNNKLLVITVMVLAFASNLLINTGRPSGGSGRSAGASRGSSQSGRSTSTTARTGQQPRGSASTRARTNQSGQGIRSRQSNRNQNRNGRRGNRGNRNGYWNNGVWVPAAVGVGVGVEVASADLGDQGGAVEETYYEDIQPSQCNTGNPEDPYAPCDVQFAQRIEEEEMQ